MHHWMTLSQHVMASGTPRLERMLWYPRGNQLNYHRLFTKAKVDHGKTPLCEALFALPAAAVHPTCMKYLTIRCSAVLHLLLSAKRCNRGGIGLPRPGGRSWYNKN